MLIVVGLFIDSAARAQDAPNNEARLARWLKQYPEADANKDGVLTPAEATAYARANGIRAGNLAAGKKAAGEIKPTQADVRYGMHERNVLDFYQAKAERPTPLVVFIHGGGFRAGDKSSVSPQIASACLAKGVSVAAINYRFRPATPIQDILRDCARAVQYLRFKSADWNLDKTRVAAYGGSAGAGTSLWLAFHDDLADPNSADPMLRESTRLTCAGATSCQFSYDILAWRDLFGDAVSKFNSGDDPPTFYGLASDAELHSPEGQKLRADCDMRGLISKDDPPVFLSSAQEGGEVSNRGHLLHHPKHAEAIQIRCKECGVKAIAHLPGLKIEPPQDEPQDLTAFLLQHLK